MQKLSNIINRFGELGLILFLSILAVVVFLQVVFRYVLQLPLFWTEELARYCLVWASLLGGGVALKRGQHIAVTYLLDRFPPALRRITVRLSQACVGAILIVIFIGGIQLVQITQNQLSPALRISMSYPYLAIPIGSLVMLVHIAASLFKPVPEPADGVCQL